MFDAIIFGNNLKNLRETKRVSASAFAKLIGKSKSLISRWESGERVPTIEELWKVADYFEISIDELVGRKH